MSANFFPNTNKRLSNKASNLPFLLFFLIISINILYVNSNECKDNPNFNNINCFNRLHIFNHERIRGGHFITNKNGDLIIEYSVDTLPYKRFFYGLKSEDEKNYFQTENGFFEYSSEGITIDETEFLNRKLDSINYFVYFENEEDNSEKEYLFSVSPYKSMVELQEFGTNNRYTWSLKNFLNYNKYDIFPYEIFLLELKNENCFLISFTPKIIPEDPFIENNTVLFQQFKLNSFDENSYEEIINSFDEKSRQKFLYLFSVDNSEKFGMA